MDIDHKLEQAIVSCLDLTALGDDDDEALIEGLCRRSVTVLGPVASVCVLPRFVAVARAVLEDMEASIPVGTVANFPGGNQPLAAVERAIDQARSDGASEIDVVFPYRSLLAGNVTKVADFLQRTRAAASGLCLKVILETGELRQEECVHRASLMAMKAGADFIKTSTGKASVNATPDAAAVMLKAIRKLDGACGFKAAGGIRTLEDARQYVDLAVEIMGRDWVRPTRFRIGASSLLDNLPGLAGDQG